MRTLSLLHSRKTVEIGDTPIDRGSSQAVYEIIEESSISVLKVLKIWEASVVQLDFLECMGIESIKVVEFSSRVLEALQTSGILLPEHSGADVIIDDDEFKICFTQEKYMDCFDVSAFKTHLPLVAELKSSHNYFITHDSKIYTHQKGKTIFFDWDDYFKLVFNIVKNYYFTYGEEKIFKAIIQAIGDNESGEYFEEKYLKQK